LPEQPRLGRTRRYCAQACRQRAYEQRHLLGRAGLPGDAVVVARRDLDDLQDRLYQLRCAVEDVSTALCERAGRAELEGVARNVVAAAGDLERLWVAPAPPG
jgi:hypothetical protein